MMSHYDSVILGAGLSGLAAALTLQQRGLRVAIYEAHGAVGGRVKSRRTADGFLLDEGFQVLLNSYPELRNFIDVTELGLGQFNSGALVFTGEKLELVANPIIHPETLLTTLIKSRLTMKDKALVLKLVAQSQVYHSDSEVMGKTTQEFLSDFGFSEDFIEIFWRPFLTGILLDSDLKVDAGYFLFLIKCFCVGKVSLPSQGMSDLPGKMAAKLVSGSLFLNQAAKKWSSQHVDLASGEVVKAKSVICAFDASISDRPFQKIPYQSVTTFYLTSPALKQTGWGKWLILIPRQFGFSFDHMTLLSETAPGYTQSEPLLSVSVVGRKVPPVEQIAKEIDQISGLNLSLQLIEKIEVAKALPAITENQMGFRENNGVIYCGDRWTTPSINGALRSGRLSAEEVIRKLAAEKL